MATYKYLFGDKGSTSNFYIEYNLSPDGYSTGTQVLTDTIPVLTAGSTVNISGRAYAKGGRINEIVAEFAPSLYSLGSINRLETKFSCSVPKATRTNISLSYTFTADDISNMFNTSDRAARICFNILEMNGPTVSYSDMPQSSSEYNYIIARYRLDPSIISMDFERCDAYGAWANDGLYFRCKELKLSKNAQASLSEFTTAKIVCTGTDGSERTVNLTQAQLQQAFTSSGYTETGYNSSNIFYGFTSTAGVTYTLTITLGDQYEQSSFADQVMRSFARLHLSGAKNGGVAVGMFSGSTDSNPMFEVAESHQSRFYGPVKFEGSVEGVSITYSSGETNTGNHWINGKPIYRYVVSKSVNLVAGGSITVATIPWISSYRVISMTGTAYQGSAFWPIPYLWPSNLQLGLGMNLNAGEIVLRGGTSRNETGLEVTIIVEYTK